MSEIYKIPIPLSNYLNLIDRKASPYYDLVNYIVEDMEKNYKEGHPEHGIIYTINPRQLREQIEEKIPSDKLTSINISRTILAFLYGSRLKRDKDYYVTTSSGGRKNYHIRVDYDILSILRLRL
jgi:hypothetical protein